MSKAIPPIRLHQKLSAPEMAKAVARAQRTVLTMAAGSSMEVQVALKRTLTLAKIVAMKAQLGLSPDRELSTIGDAGSTISTVMDELGQAVAALQAMTETLTTFVTVSTEEAKVLSLKPAIMKIVEALESTTDTKIDLQLNLGDCEAVLISQGELDFVLKALVTNALEAVAGLPTQKRQVSIKAATQTDSETSIFTLTITNNGLGLPATLKQQPFAPVTSVKATGLGLSLALTEQIVTGNKGSIEISTPANQETQVEITFPLREIATLGKSTGEIKPLTRGQLAQMEVVFVDDEPVIQASTGRLLGNMGFKAVHVYASAEDAGYAMSHEDIPWPDVIISDQSMPGRKGHEFLAQVHNICQDTGQAKPALLIYSGDILSSDAPVLETIQALDIVWLSKPLSDKYLAREISRAIAGETSEEAELQTVIDNPYRTWIGRVIHDINNGLAAPTFYLYLYADPAERNEELIAGLISGMEVVIENYKAFTNLTALAKRDQAAFATMEWFKLPLPEKFKAESANEAWSFVAEEDRVNFAFVSTVYTSEIAQNAQIIETTLVKLRAGGTLTPTEQQQALTAVQDIASYNTAIGQNNTQLSRILNTLWTEETTSV